MTTIIDEINNHLEPLVGLRLSIARRAADLRIFQFGSVRLVDKGTVGEYALHIQCPWRIEGPDAIITGRTDLWKPAVFDDSIDWDTWDYETSLNLQDKILGDLLQGFDPETRSLVNKANHLVVQQVQADVYGGAVITLSGGYRLVLFPSGTNSEDWRIFQPTVDIPHFVISGGKIGPEH